MLKHSLIVTVLITIVVIFGLSIGGYALMDSSNFQYQFRIELKDGLKIETVINKGQVK